MQAESKKSMNQLKEMIRKDDETKRFIRCKSRSKATGGTGLGLAIVKHIVEIHDAKIEGPFLYFELCIDWRCIP